MIFFCIKTDGFYLPSSLSRKVPWCGKVMDASPARPKIIILSRKWASLSTEESWFIHKNASHGRVTGDNRRHFSLLIACSRHNNHDFQGKNHDFRLKNHHFYIQTHSAGCHRRRQTHRLAARSYSNAWNERPDSFIILNTKFHHC